MIAATSSFAGVQITKAVAAPKATGRVALVVQARRTKVGTKRTNFLHQHLRPIALHAFPLRALG
jgi:hypothetical protein